MSSLDYLDLCRLCLVKDRVSVPIFEGEGDVRQIFLKIAACLPVKVAREDKLPKKICDDCLYKVELFYQFWNTTANAEKQLLQWLGEVGLEDKQGYVSNVLNPNVMKQEQSTENRLDGNVMQQVGEHQNNMGMGMMDNMGLGIPIIISTSNQQQQITSVPMDNSGSNVQTVQAVPGPSSQTTHNQMSQNQTNTTQHEEEEESSEEEENSDDECDGDEGLPVKEESEEDPSSSRTIEPTTFVNVSLACDEAGPSGLQQQKLADIPEMPIAQPADGDPKSGGDPIAVQNEMLDGNMTFRLVVLAPWQVVENEELKRRKLNAQTEMNGQPPIISLPQVIGMPQIVQPAIIGQPQTIGHLYPLGQLPPLVQSSTSEKSQSHMQSNKVDEPSQPSIPNEKLNVRVDSPREFCTIIKEENDIPEKTEDFVERTEEKSEILPSELEFGPDVEPNESPMDQEEDIINNPSNVCIICDKTFESGRKLRRHIKRSHIVPRFKCDICTLPCTSVQSLGRHKLVHQPDVFFNCDACHMKYRSKATLRFHRIRQHSDQEAKFVCEHCGKRYRIKQDLTNHIRHLHIRRLEMCRFCGKEFLDIRAHERRHQNPNCDPPNQHNCHLCHRKFRHRSGLGRHLLIHKNGYNCEDCGKKFHNHNEYWYHKQHVHNQTKITCDVCHKTFGGTDGFYHHVLTHAGIRPYKCDICGGDFTQRSSLLRHRRTHPGPLPPMLSPTPQVGKLAANYLKKYRDGEIDKSSVINAKS